MKRGTNFKEINIDIEGRIPGIVRRGTELMIEPTLTVGTKLMIEPILQTMLETTVEASMWMTKTQEVASTALRTEIEGSMLVTMVARDIKIQACPELKERKNPQKRLIIRLRL